jgi:hypothetical protein
LLSLYFTLQPKEENKVGGIIMDMRNYKGYEIRCLLRVIMVRNKGQVLLGLGVIIVKSIEFIGNGLYISWLIMVIVKVIGVRD